jgi:hypothetical protein
MASKQPELQRRRLHGSSDELVMLRGRAAGRGATRRSRKTIVGKNLVHVPTCPDMPSARYTPEPAAAHWTGPGMRQPAQAVSSYCNALRKNCQSLPFNAMRRSRKALDKNRQHGLASEGLPSNGRYTEEGEECSAR